MTESLREWRDSVAARRAAMTTQERHGSGLLTLYDGKPVAAEGCELQGAAENAEGQASVTAERLDREAPGMFAEAPAGGGGVWARPLAPSGRVWRRGRLLIVPGIRIVFTDEPHADIPQRVSSQADGHGLEFDLHASEHLRSMARQSDLFCSLLYAALAGFEWRRVADGMTWSYSLRDAGGIVAALRGQGDYLDWFCGGREGSLDDALLADLAAIGWQPVL